MGSPTINWLFCDGRQFIYIFKTPISTTDVFIAHESKDILHISTTWPTNTIHFTNGVPIELFGFRPICLYVWTTYVNFIHLFRLIFVWYQIQINYFVYKQKQNYYLGIKSLNSYKNNKERLLSFDNRLNKCSYLDDVMRSNQLNTKFHTHIHIWLNIHSILQVFTNTICIIVIIFTS